MRTATAIVLALVIIMVASAAGTERDQLWSEYARFTSPFVTQPPVGEPATQHTRRLLVLLVRGLRSTDVESMPALKALGRRGAAITLTLQAPTYALPAWLTLFSGATHQIHGSTTDGSPRNPALDTIFTRLRVSGQSSAIIGSARWNELYGADATRVEVIETSDAGFQDEQATNAVLQTLRDPAASERLIVAELRVLDVQRSLTETTATASALAATDIRINAIGQAADLANNTLVVVSDHGALADGRFGGDEPEVARVPLLMAGAGIASGARLDANATDLAPSITLLLGLPPPLHAQGAPLWDAIASRALLASARQLTAFYESWSEAAREPRFAAELLRDQETALASGNRERYSAWSGALERAADAQREHKLAGERRSRLPIVIGAAFVLLAVALIVLNSAPGATIGGVLIYLVGWQAFTWLLRGYTDSLSQFSAADPRPILAASAFDASLVTALACVVAAGLAVRFSDSLASALNAVAGAVALILIVNAGSFLAFYWRWGDAYTWTLPDAPALVSAMFSLNRIGALNMPLNSALPDLPLVIPALLLTAVLWLVFGRREAAEA
jgi:hypothetical protein